jgi:hypothetical protein
MKQTSAAQQGSKQASDKNAIRPFHVHFPEAELTELRRRIKATKWPERETVTDASQGVQLATTQALARYWATEYDWRKVEARLNALPNLITNIDGLDIHFIHVRSKHQNALPMIVTHGWPGSIISIFEIIDVDPRHYPLLPWCVVERATFRAGRRPKMLRWQSRRRAAGVGYGASPPPWISVLTRQWESDRNNACLVP